MPISEKPFNGEGIDLASIDIGGANITDKYYHHLVDYLSEADGKINFSVYSSELLSVPNLKIHASGNENKMFLGSGVTLGNSLFKVKGKNNTIIVCDGVRLKNVQISVKGKSSLIIIGEGTTWESGQCICDSSCEVIIGKDCMISNHVMVRTSDGHGIFDIEKRELINKASSVLIDSHVWLGNSSNVNKGTRIQKNVVLGSNSVATGLLKSNSIYAGVPAKQIKEGIIWSRSYSFEDIPLEVFSHE